MRPGQIERRTHDYIRHGTTSLFTALQVKTGKVLADCRRRHRFVEFRAFRHRIKASLPDDLEIHLIRYIDHQNQARKSFIWTKTTDQILASVARFCRRISDSGH